jgi:hypothetical protein
MPYAPQTALRNRRIIWGASARGPGAGHLSRPITADADPHRRDPGHGHRCSCSDHCGGIADSPSCNGHPDADGGAHGAAVDDGHAEHPDANCYTVSRLDAGACCCSDPGDCQPDAACRTAADGTA